MEEKLQKVKKILSEKKLDAFIITNPVNIFYLTGFKGVSQTEREAILVISKTKSILITANLYRTEAAKVKSENLNVKIVLERNRLFSKIPKAIPSAKRIGFEENNLKYNEYVILTRQLAEKNLKLIPTKNLIENLRAIKTEDEIRKIEKAQIISQKAFDQIIKTVKPGQTEDEISDRLSKIIKSLGGQGLAFESIVAAGENSAKPHHVISNKRLAKNDVLLFDFGAKFEDYCADLSRTIFIGKAKDEHRNAYHHVKKAQSLAIEKISKEPRADKAFHAANEHFRKHNVEKNFIHGLGHGIGLEVHEEPYLRPTSKNNDKTVNYNLKEGMVFSVEPGLYFPWGGVRIEDLVVIVNGQAKPLANLSKDLILI